MSVLTLLEAKKHLEISSPTYDDELQEFIDAAEAAIVARCGPLTSTPTTVRVQGGTGTLVLPTLPALDITSVTPVNGTALTVGDLYLDAGAGLVTHVSGTTFTNQSFDVVYNAGRTTCPPDLLMAVKELVRHLWQTQRGPSRRPGSQVSEATANTVPGAAYLLPFRVSELIAPHVQHGFA